MMAPHKRTLEEAESLLVDIRSIAVNIPGTLAPKSFFEDTLVSYIKEHISNFLSENFESAEVQKAVAALREQASKEKESKVEGVVEIPSGGATKEDVVEAVAKNVRWQLDGNRSSAELQTLEELVWKAGYETKQIKGELFEDVGPMLKMLTEEGFHLFVYSSLGVENQKLFFASASQEDLTDVFEGHFDTSIGSKTDAASYKKIAAEAKHEPREVLYLTHIPQEAEAAVAAGLRSALVIRPGNEELTDEHLQQFACIERLDELYGDEDDEDDIKHFAGDNGEGDDDEEDDDEEGDEDDEEGEEDEGEDA